MLSLCLTFQGTARLFSTMPASLYIPMGESSNFSTFSPIFPNICLFDNSHAGECEMAVTVVLICIFVMTQDVKHLLICLLAIWISSLEKCLFRFLLFFEL